MSQIERKGITPEEMIRDIENSVKLYRENKHVFQVELKDLDFDIKTEDLEALGMKLPFRSIGEAEQALRIGLITLTLLKTEQIIFYRCSEVQPPG